VVESFLDLHDRVRTYRRHAVLALVFVDEDYSVISLDALKFLGGEHLLHVLVYVASEDEHVQQV